MFWGISKNNLSFYRWMYQHKERMTLVTLLCSAISVVFFAGTFPHFYPQEFDSFFSSIQENLTNRLSLAIPTGLLGTIFIIDSLFLTRSKDPLLKYIAKRKTEIYFTKTSDWELFKNIWTKDSSTSIFPVIFSEENKSITFLIDPYRLSTFMRRQAKKNSEWEKLLPFILKNVDIGFFDNDYVQFYGKNNWIFHPHAHEVIPGIRGNVTRWTEDYHVMSSLAQKHYGKKKPHPHFSALPPKKQNHDPKQTILEWLEQVFIHQKRKGCALGENHQQNACKQFILDNMSYFKKLGITTLFIESSYFYDFCDQEDLDNYFKTGIINPKLNLITEDAKILEEARKHGIRIVGIETFPPMGITKDSEGPLRAVMFNLLAKTIIEKELKPDDKYLVFAGALHTSGAYAVEKQAQPQKKPSDSESLHEDASLPKSEFYPGLGKFLDIPTLVILEGEEPLIKFNIHKHLLRCRPHSKTFIFNLEALWVVPKPSRK